MSRLLTVIDVLVGWSISGTYDFCLYRSKLIRFTNGCQKICTLNKNPCFYHSFQVLHDFPLASANLPFEYLFDLIPVLQPRSFSIASSLRVSTYEFYLVSFVIPWQYIYLNLTVVKRGTKVQIRSIQLFFTQYLSYRPTKRYDVSTQNNRLNEGKIRIHLILSLLQNHGGEAKS